MTIRHVPTITLVATPCTTAIAGCAHTAPRFGGCRQQITDYVEQQFGQVPGITSGTELVVRSRIAADVALEHLDEAFPSARSDAIVKYIGIVLSGS